MGRLGVFIKQIYSVVLLVLVWEGVSQVGLVHAFLLPPPSVICLRLMHLLFAGDLGQHMLLSLYRTLVSFVLAVVIAVPLGLAMARSRLVEWFWEPMLAVGFPTPKIVFLHLFVLWFGLYDLPKIVMATVEGVLPIATATYLGTRHIDPYLLWSARNLGTSAGRLLWKVMLPAALPQIMNGAQIALPICFIVIFVTEMLLGGGGLGDTMILAQRFADSEGVFVGMLAISLLGYIAIWGMAWIRRTLLPWHVETQERHL